MSMPWQPLTDFEEEIVNLNPHNDFIFGGLLTLHDDDVRNKCPRPPKHLEYVERQLQQEQKEQEQYNDADKNAEKTKNELHLLSEIQRMAGIKSIGEQVTLNDWNNYEHIEQETIGMMRYFGMEPSTDEPLSEDITLATYPIRNVNPLRRNGNRIIPLFFDDDIFKLRPLVPSTEHSTISNDNVTNNINNCNDKQQNNSLISSSVTTSNTSSDDYNASTTYTISSSLSNNTYNSKSTSSSLLDKMLSNKSINQMNDRNVTAIGISDSFSSSSALPFATRPNVLQESNNSNTGTIRKHLSTEQWPNLISSMNTKRANIGKIQCNNVPSNGRTYASVVQQKPQQQQKSTEENELVKKTGVKDKQNIYNEYVRVVTIAPSLTPKRSPKTTITVTFSSDRKNPNYNNKPIKKFLPFHTTNDVYKMKRTKSN